MLIRRNDSAAELKGHPEYRFRVGITVPLRTPDERGLPTTEESNQLNAIEDSLSNLLQADERSLQVLAITTGGMREFVFYSRDSAHAEAVLRDNQSAPSGHELQSYVSEDPQWQLYAQFA